MGQFGQFELSLSREVDVLFVLDNTKTMGEEQAAFAAGIGRFFEVLERPEVSANYRVGVTTTDNGNMWCSFTSPEQGALQFRSCRSHPEDFLFEGQELIDVTQQACYERCPEAWSSIETRPTPLSPGQYEQARAWVERTDGRTNLPDGLTPEQALQCIGPQGINGCGFESPLESMRLALKQSSYAGSPQVGFLRDDAVLALVLVTDEIDCSNNKANESIFSPDGDRVFWSDPTAFAPTSAVCWSSGVACSGSGTYDECRAVDYRVDGSQVSGPEALNEAALHPLSYYIDTVQQLENEKQARARDQQVLVSVIAGAEPGGTITYQDAQDPDFQRNYGIGPGCSSPRGEAPPPVRLAEFAQAFQVGDIRNLFSICNEDYGPTLGAIAELIAEQVEYACMPACVADADPSTPDQVDPRCYLLQRTPDDEGGNELTSILPCDEGELPAGEDVCYRTQVGDELTPFCAAQGFNLQFELIRRDGTAAPPGTSVTAECLLSESRDVDCPLLP